MERMRQSCRMVNNFPFLSDNESEKNSYSDSDENIEEIEIEEKVNKLNIKYE